MSASPQPEGLADVLRQLVALGSDTIGDERLDAAEKGMEQEAEGMGSGCEKVESKERIGGISPLMSFNGDGHERNGGPPSP
jgi:hypothetical protein